MSAKHVRFRRCEPHVGRRGFLQASVGAASVLAIDGMSLHGQESEVESASNASAHGAKVKTKLDLSRGCPPEIRAALSGPWPSIRTPFKQDGQIDFDALHGLLNFLIEQAKVKAVVLTWGDSLFSLLTDDDFLGEFIRKTCLLTHDRWALSAGGAKQNHLNMLPFGADGYLSTFVNFRPDIAWSYWNAVWAGDMPNAIKVIRDFDLPLFDYIRKSEGGFDAVMHGIYEAFGVTKRWRRAPYHSLSDKQMESLTEFLRETKILS